MSSSPQTRKRVLGIGSPRFAHTEFEDLKQIADVFWFTPETHPQVVDGVARLVKEHGPMDAAYVLFGTANYGPFMQDVLGELFSTRVGTREGRMGADLICGAACRSPVSWMWAVRVRRSRL